LEITAALRFSTLDLFGVCLDKPAAGFLDRGQGGAAFALACALGTLAPDRHALQAALESGWDALVHGGDVVQT